MAAINRVRLLDAKLEFTRDLAPEERADVAAITLPVVNVAPGPFGLDALLRVHHGFAATILDGLLVRALTIGDQSGIHLLGPGDLLLRDSDLSPPWLEDVAYRAPAPARLAVLGTDFLSVAKRAPQVTLALYERLADQMHRLTGQLVICQLPRVDQRVLAMLWLLAESWGHVTPGGIRLRLALTHETLGSMVGARRPTVTLALRKLSQQGAVVHQDSGWLLLEPPPEPARGAGAKVLLPEIAAVSVAPWAQEPQPAPDPSVRYAELRATVQQLRERHHDDRQQTHEQLKRIRTARVRTNAVREQISRDALIRRLPPSS
jgi:CRP/FNR family cyclic AMP-dependent transcriptional regulator